MFFRSNLFHTDVDASLARAMRWIQDYEARRTPGSEFNAISVPSGKGKGAKSYVLQLNGGASYILKISKPEEKYKERKLQQHLKKLFSTVEEMQDKEAIVAPILASVKESRLCLVYVPCKTVKRKDVAISCDRRDSAKKLFHAVQYLHKKGFVGFDIKADNLLSCAGSYGLTDYENCISTTYHKASPDISGNFNLTWRDVDGKAINKGLVSQDFDTYKVYYMALDYIALFAMLGSYSFSFGMASFVTAFKIEEQEERIRKKKDQCQQQLLSNIITLLKFPERATQYATRRWVSLFPRSRRNALKL